MFDVKLRNIGLVSVALVALLAGGAPAWSTQVGTTSAANEQVIGTPPAQASRTLYIGTDIVFNERLQTDDKGLAQILFLDRSAFTIGHSSDIVIDEFLYDPDSSAGRLAATMTEGVLRFVGGALSKKQDGVTINTPLVTIGVRGAIIAVSVDPATGRTRVRMDFGDSVTVRPIGPGGGKPVTIVKEGYEVVAEPGGPLSNPAPASDESIAQSQAALTGESGTNGGATKQLTSEYVAGTQIVQLGSTTDPVTPRLTGGIGDPDRTTTADQTDGVQDRTVAALQPPPPPPLADLLPLETGSGRFLAAGDSYNVVDDTPIANPGVLGLLGGSPETDQAVVGAQVLNGRLLLTLSSNAVVDLPYQTGGFVVDNASTPLGSAIGTGFVSPSQEFYYYWLVADAGATATPGGAATTQATIVDFIDPRPMILFGGVAFDPLAAPAESELLTYAIHPDAIQGLDIPFVSTQLVPDATGFVTTPFYVLVQSTGTVGTPANGENSKTLFGALQISGQDTSQISGAVLFVSDVFNDPDTGKITLSTGRRGSFRQSSPERPVTMSGGIGSLKDGDGNSVFGSEGEYFVLGHGSESLDAYFDSYANGTPEGVDNIYATQHLVSFKASADTALPSRPERQLTMYSAGMVEFPNFSASPPVIHRTSAVDESVLSFNPATNTLGARMFQQVIGSSGIAEYRLGFGQLPEGYGGSTYIDADRYGARENRAATQIIANTEGLWVLGTPEQFAFLYFMPATLASVDEFLPTGVAFCDCAFMEWGYWGGRLRHEDPFFSSVESSDYFHLETWIAGDLPDLADIPFEGEASYSGHAIGDVDYFGDYYTAVGNFDMTWYFGPRSGNATISNFDGMTFVSSPSSENGRDFSGDLSIGVGSTGEIRGSFFTDGINPVAGVGGDFHISSGRGYVAAGTFMGEQVVVPQE